MRKECQIKVAGAVEGSLLVSLGAEFLGRVNQKDNYFEDKDGCLLRIREEGENFLLTKKGNDFGERAREKEISEEVVDGRKAERLIKENSVKTVICKNRSLFRLENTLIVIDKVERIGEFVEVRAENEAEIFQTLRKLRLNEKDAIKESYLDLSAKENLSSWLKVITRFHEKVGELTFGITSGILTTIGVLTGVNSATDSKLSVVAAIIAIAVADSCSDTFGMYLSKMSERGVNRKSAIRYAVGTLAAKFFFPLTFIVPILFFSLRVGVVIDILWGLAALSLLSIEQAIVGEKPILKTVLRNIVLAELIVFLSTLVGLLISRSS